MFIAQKNYVIIPVNLWPMTSAISFPDQYVTKSQNTKFSSNFYCRGFTFHVKSITKRSDLSLLYLSYHFLSNLLTISKDSEKEAPVLPATISPAFTTCRDRLLIYGRCTSPRKYGRRCAPRNCMQRYDKLSLFPLLIGHRVHFCLCQATRAGNIRYLDLDNFNPTHGVLRTKSEGYRNFAWRHSATNLNDKLLDKSQTSWSVILTNLNRKIMQMYWFCKLSIMYHEILTES